MKKIKASTKIEKEKNFRKEGEIERCIKYI